MSEADKMFEALGYTVEEALKNIYIYIDDCEYIEHDFVIHKDSKSVSFYKIRISKEELKAINQKCKELGWLDE